MNDGAPLTPTEAAALADSLEADLRRHVLDAWFPRCVDRERGGFLCRFDRRWRPATHQPRMLEFQARQTRALAALALAYPEDDRWAEWTLHGFAYLRDRLWDEEHGGWYWLADKDGVPQHGATKHAHGSSYAVGAAAGVFLATGRTEALELSLEGFDWVERAHVDDEHGGYHGWVTREGRWIRCDDEAPPGLRDPLEGPAEHKNINVHADLTEAYACLLRASGDGRVAERTDALRDLIEQRFVLADGSLHYSFTREWGSVSQVERFGYGVQWVGRLALTAAGHTRPGVVELAEAVVRHALDRAWDEQRGGFAYAGPAAPPDALEGVSLVVRPRAWWVQAEALRALLAIAYARPDEPLFLARFRDLLDFVRREVLDARYGGWVTRALADHGPRARLARRAPAKGMVWKDISHETEMYLACIRLLRGLPDDTPLASRP